MMLRNVFVLVFCLLLCTCGSPLEEEVVLDVKYGAARDAYLFGKYEEALELVEALMPETEGMPYMQGKAFMLQALTNKQLQQYKESYVAFDKAALIFSGINLYELEGQCLYQKGKLENMAKDYANAYKSCNAALEALAHKDENSWSLIVELEAVKASLGLGDTARTQQYLKKALAIQEGASLKFYGHYYYGLCLYWNGEVKAAMGRIEESLAAATATGNSYQQSIATHALGTMALKAGDRDMAISRIEESLTFPLTQEPEYRQQLIKARQNLATIYRQANAPAKELEALEPLLALTQTLGGLKAWQDAVFTLQELYSQTGNAQGVLRCATALQEARKLPQEATFQPNVLHMQMAQYREEQAQAKANEKADNLFNMALGLTLVSLALVALAVLLWWMYRQLRSIRQRLNQKELAYENLSEMTSWMTEHYEPITRAAFNAFVGREPLRYKVTRLKTDKGPAGPEPPETPEDE